MSKQDRKETLEAFERLLDIMDELRAKCPWDMKQSWESLRTLTIEETYELADAIIENNAEGVMEELGDLMLHLVFYSKIGVEKEAFNLKDVLDYINEKLVFRHPHIFSDVEVSGAKEVEENWEKLKLRENGGKKTVLGGIPNSLPALIKAYRIQDKARGVGFDWNQREQVWDKVQEEINEFKTELANLDEEAIEKEFGDVFFSLVNAARLYGINPENALERTNTKFIKRFNYLEIKTISKGLNLREMSLEEMDVIWEESKKED